MKTVSSLLREGLLLEEKDIIDSLWQRNPDSLLELDAHYHTYCFSIAFNIVKNKEDAEECVSDTWLKIWQGGPPPGQNVLSGPFSPQIPKIIRWKNYS